MKLTAELLKQSDSALNPLKERELDLRGLKIVVLENLGVTRDQNDALDFTDNEIKYVGNLPRLVRLKHLILSNNLVSRIDENVARSLPFLHTLVLTNNALQDLRQVVPLRKLRHLEYLSLMGNPITREKHYREFVIWRVPSVRVLDYKRITDKVRFFRIDPGTRPCPPAYGDARGTPVRTCRAPLGLRRTVRAEHQVALVRAGRAGRRRRRPPPLGQGAPGDPRRD